MESIEERVGYSVISSLCALHNWTAQSCSQSYTEKRRRKKVAEVARRINGGNEKEGQIQPVISSLSVLHHLEHTDIHRVG